MKLKPNSELGRDSIQLATKRFDYLKNWHRDLQSICMGEQIAAKISAPCVLSDSCGASDDDLANVSHQLTCHSSF